MNSSTRATHEAAQGTSRWRPCWPGWWTRLRGTDALFEAATCKQASGRPGFLAGRVQHNHAHRCVHAAAGLLMVLPRDLQSVGHCYRSYKVSVVNHAMLSWAESFDHLYCIFEGKT